MQEKNPGGSKGFDDDEDDEYGDIDFGTSSGGKNKVSLSGDVARRVEGLEQVLSASRRVGDSLELGVVAASIMEETTHLAQRRQPTMSSLLEVHFC